jgi:hypothetical protein
VAAIRQFRKLLRQPRAGLELGGGAAGGRPHTPSRFLIGVVFCFVLPSGVNVE